MYPWCRGATNFPAHLVGKVFCKITIDALCCLNGLGSLVAWERGAHVNSSFLEVLSHEFAKVDSMLVLFCIAAQTLCVRFAEFGRVDLDGVPKFPHWVEGGSEVEASVHAGCCSLML